MVCMPLLNKEIDTSLLWKTYVKYTIELCIDR